MLGVVPGLIEDYCKAHSTDESTVLKELARTTTEITKMPQMSVGHLEGTFLKLLVKLISAKKILEIGTFTGYSAIAMAEGLPEDGKLITCDIDEKRAAIAKEFFEKSPHGNKIELKMGPALHTIENLNEEFDMVFVDADKENYIEYWEKCVPLTRKGGLIVVDNTLWYGKVLDPADEFAIAIADFNDHITNDDRVEFVLLSIRDGVTLAYKK